MEEEFSNPGEPLKLGTPRHRNQQTCGFGLTEDLCGEPAKWHVWFDQGEGHALACNDHYDYIRHRDLARFANFDVHRIGEHCNVDGSLWKFATYEENGFCYVP